MLIWLYLRHIKAYKNIRYIPIWSEYNFNSYIWNNWVWKSSILQALDSFFNNKEWQINKSALIDWIKTKTNTPFITPIFLIKKEDFQKDKAVLEIISNFFWDIDSKQISAWVKGSMREFYELKDSLLAHWYTKEEYYFFMAWEKFSDEKKSIYFSSFHKEEEFRRIFLEYQISKIDMSISKLGLSDKDPEVRKLTWAKVRLENEFKDKDNEDIFVNSVLKENKFNLLTNLKDLYSYIYIPVEIDIEQFTKIETEDMQKVFDKKIIDEVRQALKWINIDGINIKLDSFIDEIAEILNKDYFYDTWDKSKKNITENDIVEKVLEAYFQKRILLKGKKWEQNKRKVSELSAWEKRQALINLIYAFLKRWEERERKLIIWLDEPENSLNVSLCFEQFEKLKEISQNNQILITTHWYWFLPVISQGYWHFLNSWEKETIDFETYDLYEYRSQIKKSIEESKGRIPWNLELKSINDLVQSIYTSIKNKDVVYNWIICEWISEKIYLEHFLEDEIKKFNINILPVGWESKVREIFDYLFLPIKKEQSSSYWKIYCLVDTDITKPADWYLVDDAVSKIISLVRLSNKDKECTTIIKYNANQIHPTEIENSLVPFNFIETIKYFPDTIQKIGIDLNSYDITDSENTDFQIWFELKPAEAKKLKKFFNDDNWIMKILFAKKYIELSKLNKNNGIPEWTKHIKSFFTLENSNKEKKVDLKNIALEQSKNLPSKVGQSENKIVIKKTLVGGTINKDKLIEIIKTNWWRAALTMSLKGAEISNSSDEIIIKTKTQISRNTISKLDNQELILSALKNLWSSISVLKII